MADREASLRSTGLLPPGVLVPARMEDERRGNMGSLVGGRVRTKLAPREGQAGPAGWRMGL